MEFKYIKELKNRSAIENFQKENNIKFPNAFVELVKSNNGARPLSNTIDTNLSKERVFKALLSFNQEDKESIFTAFKIIKDSNNNNLLPFAITPGGDYFCFDGNKAIVLWLHETDTTEKVTDSFDKLFDLMY